ncbi:MAG: hypothetical protein JOS17DRAFT_766863 [Linnemannia elongata]|nr:MAG: hypothetical protein JOS17DRAFT_766863 [Linnemannia elongata]
MWESACFPPLPNFISSMAPLFPPFACGIDGFPACMFISVCGNTCWWGHRTRCNFLPCLLLVCLNFPFLPFFLLPP